MPAEKSHRITKLSVCCSPRLLQLSLSSSAASWRRLVTAGDTELRILQRAPRDAGFAPWEGGQGEQRCHQPPAGSHSRTLGRTKFLCSVRASNSQQPLTASPLAKGWEHQWDVLGDIHSITAADTWSDTQSVSRPAHKRHQGWHVTIQSLKWSGPCQFDCPSSS